MGELIVYADGADSPRTSPAAVAETVGVREWDLLLGWTPEPRAWLDALGCRVRTVMGGYSLGGVLASGRGEYLPVRLSALPRLLRGPLRPDVAVVTAVRRRGRLVFAHSVGWGPAAARAARRGVVVELADSDLADLGGPPIPGRIVAVVDRPQAVSPSPGPRTPDDIELAIGRAVASVLPDRPVLQYGPGGIGEALLAAIDRPVRVWSGLVTDAVAGLAERGLLDGEITAGYAWGTAETMGRLAAAGLLRLRPLEETHDLARIAAFNGFVACNTALQVGLDGSVNVERVGGRVMAGIGGHADFCVAAARAPSGLSVVALRSIDPTGRSTIVPAVEVVSTPRCDVDVVVTEWGIADLRGAGDAERARRIATVAAPQHRDVLLRAATG
jgi:acyl-CoA hydrolase